MLDISPTLDGLKITLIIKFLQYDLRNFLSVRLISVEVWALQGNL